jgi:uncharacterized protein (TIGR03000 family)
MSFARDSPGFSAGLRRRFRHAHHQEEQTMWKYSIALTLALVGAGVSPAWAGHGCWGGGRFYSYGCYGGCSGCQGGWYSSGWMPAGSGCWGGCSGWRPVGYGCHGGGGCYGGMAVGYGCHGGWSTGWMPAGNGCHGSAYVVSDWKPVNPSSSPTAPVSTSAENVAAPAQPAAPPDRRPVARPPDGRLDQVDTPAPREQNSGSADRIGLPEEMGGKAPATIVVNLPAGARLKVNNVMAGQSSSGSRKLVSPPLERGKDFHYTLRAEMVRDGRTLTASKRIAVRAGQVKKVALEFTAPAGTAEPSGPVPTSGTGPPAAPPRPTAARGSPPAD